MLGPIDIALLCLASIYLALIGAWVAFGGGERKIRVFQTIAFTFALGFSWVLLELPVVFGDLDYAEIFEPEGTDWRTHSERVNRPDPELIHVHWPNAEYQGEVEGNLVRLGIPNPGKYEVDVRYDRNGFRNDREYERASIAIVGDSFVEAAIIRNEATMVRQLAEITGVDVVNLGQSGYGLRQELAVLERYALPLEPRIVVWFFFGGNDMRDIRAYDGKLERFGKPHVVRPMGMRLFTRNAIMWLTDAIGRPIVPKPQLDPAQFGRFERETGEIDTVYVGLESKPWDDYEWGIAVETLGEAKRLCDEAGAEFVLAYVPLKLRVYKGNMEIPAGSPLADATLNDLPEELGKWAASQGIPYLDTTVPLRAFAESGRHPYLLDDVHWNEAGHRVVAEAVRDLIGPSESWAAPAASTQ